MRHADGRVSTWHQQHESIIPACPVSTFTDACGGVMTWGMFSWHVLDPLILIIYAFKYHSLRVSVSLLDICNSQKLHNDEACQKTSTCLMRVNYQKDRIEVELRIVSSISSTIKPRPKRSFCQNQPAVQFLNI